MENKKILILGAKGNLGQFLAKAFGEENNYDAAGWDREEIDITDQAMLKKKINELKPYVIINAAAYNAVDKCENEEKEFELASKINTDAPGYLAEIALANNAILVHYSTDYVFSGENKVGCREDDAPKPISKYGETKLAGEKAILNLKNKGLKYYIVRTSKLFGPKGESLAAKPSFFDIMLKLAKEREQLDVVDEEESCFTYTPDLARATKKLIESGKDFGIYHIINSGPCTWFEAAKELFKIAGINIKVIPVSGDKFPRPAKRPKYSVLLNTKLEPMRDWREALKDYLSKKL